MLVDTHAHVYSLTYNNIDEVLKNAKEKNVSKIFNCSEDIKTSLEVIALSKEYMGFLLPCIGVHPQNIEGLEENFINKLEEMIKNNKIIAIGEIGLDYYWTSDNKDAQKKIFRLQLELAEKYNLPVFIHNREATEDIINILKDFNLKGIIHCFNGSYEIAEEFIKMGFLLGINGIVTFKNCKLIELLKKIDIKNIVFETDAPFLSPVPYRGKKNESAYVTETVKFVSKELDISYENLLNITYDNLKGIFNNLD